MGIDEISQDLKGHLVYNYTIRSVLLPPAVCVHLLIPMKTGQNARVMKTTVHRAERM